MTEPTNGKAGPTTNSGPGPLTPDVLNRLEEIVGNVTSMRSDLFRQLFDPRRDIDDECGYPRSTSGSGAGTINPELFRDLYEREALATRVVQVLPKESWQATPLVYEDDDPRKATAFEQAWDNLGSTLRGGNASWFTEEEGSIIWEYLRRVDILSGIGHFGVLLLGIDDGLDLQEPAEGVTTLQPPNSAPYQRNRQGEESRPGLYYDLVSNAWSNPTEEMELDPRTKQPWVTAECTVTGSVGSITSNRDSGTYINPRQPSTGASTAGGAPLDTSRYPTEDHPTSGPAYMGTEAQYVGIQLGPSEFPSEQPAKKEHRLVFLRAFDESLVQVVQYEANLRNPRFGQPVMYRITLNDPREQHSGIGLSFTTVRVHWSRVLHIADNLGSSEIFGVPRMRPVLNRLLDLRKLYGGSAEMYWRGAFPGYTIESNPQLGGDVVYDKSGMRDLMENWQNGLQRMMVLAGFSMKGQAPQVVDPTPQINVQIQAICIQLGIPQRVFMGSERGELASSQDDASWNDRLKERQLSYLTPRVIVPFIDRLIALGVLPEPGTGRTEQVGEEPEELHGMLTAPKPGLAPAGGGGGKPAFGGKGTPPPPSVGNVFCATGEGGGVDPSCSTSRGGTAGDTKVIPDQGLKPARAPKFHRGSQAEAMNAAVRMSAFHGKPAYMFSTGSGIKVVTEKPDLPKGAKLHKFSATHDGESYTVTREIVVNHLDTLSPEALHRWRKIERSAKARYGLSLTMNADGSVTAEAKAGYKIEWPDLDSLTDTERAAILLQRTQAYAAYVAGNVEAMIPPHDYMTSFDNLTEEEAQQILESANKAQEEHMADQQALADQHGMVPTPPPGFEHPAPEPTEEEPSPVKMGQGETLVHPQTGKVVAKTKPAPVKPPTRNESEEVDNAELEGGQWMTTKEGHHVYIKDGQVVAGNPHVVELAKEKEDEHTSEKQEPKKEAPTKKHETKTDVNSKEYLEKTAPSEQQVKQQIKEAKEMKDLHDWKGTPTLMQHDIKSLKMTETDEPQEEDTIEAYKKKYLAGEKVKPIFADEDGHIVDGHHRYLGAKAAGLEKVWVVKAVGKKGKEQKELSPEVIKEGHDLLRKSERLGEEATKTMPHDVEKGRALYKESGDHFDKAEKLLGKKEVFKALDRVKAETKQVKNEEVEVDNNEDAIDPEEAIHGD